MAMEETKQDVLGDIFTGGIIASTDLTVAEFCRSEGVSTPSFYRWRKLASSTSSPSPRFVSLTLNIVQVATLTLPGGASIDLPGDLSRSRLTDLFSAVL